MRQREPIPSTNTAFIVMGGMSVTLEHLEDAATRKDFETVLLTVGRLKEQGSDLRKALLTDALRSSIQQVKERNERKQCEQVGGDVLPTNEKADARNASPFSNTNSNLLQSGE